MAASLSVNGRFMKQGWSKWDKLCQSSWCFIQNKRLPEATTTETSQTSGPVDSPVHVFGEPWIWKVPSIASSVAG